MKVERNPQPPSHSDELDALHLMRELEIHQLELQAQNEELQTRNRELEARTYELRVALGARRRAEAALREESRRVEEGRRKDEFLAMLSHELRNPLSSLKSALLVLDLAAPGSVEARRAKAVIDRQVGHLTRIVDDLLDVTRIVRGKMPLHRERFDLAELARNCLEDYRPQFRATGVALELSVGAEPLWMDADRTRLVQVVGNLLSNALKFTPSGGAVRVALEADDACALLKVSDTGMGVDPALHESLFEPFRQGPQSLDRARGGLGLGLAAAKGLVVLHGGKIALASEGMGRGTTVTVTLPRSAAPDGVTAQKQTRHRRSFRVLLIEDQADAAEMLATLLQFFGHVVVVATDGKAGIALAREQLPEVVICDLALPEMDGYEVAEALRAESRLAGAHLIALSGYALPADVHRALDAGFDRHLAKPLSLERLQQVLDEVPEPSDARAGAD